MKSAASESFGYNEEQIVSSDVIGMKYGSLFDATQTMVAPIADGLYQVQVVSWYDNENSYTSQMVRTIKFFAELGTFLTVDIYRRIVGREGVGRTGSHCVVCGCVRFSPHNDIQGIL